MEDLKKLQDDLWDYAETGFKEYKSAEAMCKYLEKKGFEVNRGICNMDTAFDAVYGSGKPVIAIL
ncbi:MAG: amidohydrolase, partial [Bacillota bacterium]|nr:amidohydrolase [Bacillota bacterium]